MSERVKNSILAVVSVIVLVFIDQLTKLFAVQKLSSEKGGADFVIWDGVFRLRYLENKGASFGILQGRKTMLILVTILVFVALCWVYSRIPNERRFRLLQGITVFVMAGAVGNFVDRVRFGYVVDFFYFELINFPIFNMADIYITCSVLLFLFLFLFYYKDADLERILPIRKKETRE